MMLVLHLLRVSIIGKKLQSVAIIQWTPPNVYFIVYIGSLSVKVCQVMYYSIINF